MGYATITRVPQVSTHKEAKKIYDSTKPIRGRVPEIRPLGERRDVDTYSVRMNGDDVELVLYKTAVITFRANGDVMLACDGWSSVSTHQFIKRVLGLRARGKGSSSIITVQGQDYTITGDGKLILRKEDGRWGVLHHEVLWGYKANRKALTNVRSRYSEFRKYLKGFASLRQEEKVLYQGRPHEHRFNVIKFGAQELVDMFGVVDSTYQPTKAIDRRQTDVIFAKPTTPHWMTTEAQKQDYRNRVRRYEENMKAFTDTLLDGQPEDVKHHNFYQGALAFLMEAHMELRRNPSADWILHDHKQEVEVKADEWMVMVDEAISKYHAEEVLDCVQLEVGKTPNTKYKKWISEEV